MSALPYYTNPYARGLMGNTRYARGNAMLQAGINTSPVGHWTQGLARMLQAGVGAYEMNRAEKEDEASRKEKAQRLGAALQKFGSGDMGSAIADLAAHDDSGTTAINMAMYGQQRKDREADRTAQWARDDERDIRNHNQQRQLAAEARASQPGPAPVAAFDTQTGKVAFVDAGELRRNPGRYAPPDQGKPSTPFAGNSMDAQSYNILLQGDPTSPAYAAAYAHVAQPKTQMDPQTGQTVMIRPDMSPFRVPSGMPQTGASASPSMPQPGTQQAPMPPQAQPQSAPVPAQPVMQPQAQAAPQPPAVLGQPTISRVGDPRLPTAEASKLRQAQIDAQTLFKALDDFTGAVGGAQFGDRAASYLGINTPRAADMNTKWANAALLAKGESLYNLGVLNGPDLEIIRRALADPSTSSGVVTGPEAYKAQSGAIKKLILDRLNAFEQKAGLPPSTFDALPPPPQPQRDGSQDGQPQQVQSKEQLDALPPGTRFTAPDGSVRIKR